MYDGRAESGRLSHKKDKKAFVDPFYSNFKKKLESTLTRSPPNFRGGRPKKRADRAGEGMGEEAIDTTPQELN